VGTNGGGQAGGRLRWDFGAAFTELSVDGTVPFFGNGPFVDGGGGNPNGPEWQSATLRTALTVGAHFR
jgi:hypothetical protein